MLLSNLNLDFFRKLITDACIKANTYLITISAQRWRIKIMLASFILCGTIVLGYGMALRPLYTTLQNLREQNMVIKRQIMQTKERLHKLAAVLQQFNKTHAIKRNQAVKIAANEANFATLLKNIADAAHISQLTIVAVQPLLEEHSGQDEVDNDNRAQNKKKNVLSKNEPKTLNDAEQNINLSAYGSYQQIMSFFVALQRLKWLVTTPSFTIRAAPAANATDKLLLSAVIKVYAMQMHAKPISKVIIGGGGRDPFVPSNDDEVVSLTAWECRDLHLLGVIQQGKETLAVVSDAAGQAHSVKVGSAIGINNGRVVKITNDAIITNIDGENVYR